MNMKIKLANRTFIKYMRKYQRATKKANKYEDLYKGPYPITQVWTNGTVTIRQDALQERMHIICIKTYHE